MRVRCVVIHTAWLGSSALALASPSSTGVCVPNRLEISIARYAGPSYSLKGTNELEYMRIMPLVKAKPVRLKPTPEQWCAFKRQLRDSGIHQWKRNYSRPDVADGLSWYVDIAFADERYVSEGMGSFPGAERDATGDAARSRQFNSLLRAVKMLINGKPFE